MKQIVWCCLVLCLGVHEVDAQSYAFGVKGGLTVGIQQWNGFNGRDPLLRYHGALFIESHNHENSASVFAQAGYHVKGSALRTRAYYSPFLMQNIEARTSNIEFQNVSLTAGIKQKNDLGLQAKYYWLFGVRGEYTIDSKGEGFLSIYDGLHNEFLFGVTIGGGLELPMGRFVSGIIEATVSPDLTRQMFLPPQDTGFTDGFSGAPIILPQQEISNVVIEISLGLRFLHEITYID
ncbi:MAG: hypothetical protein R3301_07170 [Saprospiraceae bacterium]|nr:hypothetical protein [Saprospiraceae bacterium]